MKYLIALFMVLAFAFSAQARPRVTPNSVQSVVVYDFVFGQGDLEDSDPVGVSGMCSISVSMAGADQISVYQVPYKTTAAASGTLIKQFTANQTTPVIFSAGNYYVKAVADVATTGGSGMHIQCSNTQVAADFDPTKTVVFEDAAATDDPMIYAVYNIRPIALYCVASGSVAPGTQLIHVRECNATAQSCADVGLDITLSGANDAESDVTPTDTMIEQGNYWGIHTETAGSPSASFANCTFHGERG